MTAFVLWGGLLGNLGVFAAYCAIFRRTRRPIVLAFAGISLGWAPLYVVPLFHPAQWMINSVLYVGLVVVGLHLFAIGWLEAQR